MRVLFLENDPMLTCGLPNGFKDLGHEIMISGPLFEGNLTKMLCEFRPDLIISMGWTDEHNYLKQQWVKKYVRPTGIPFIYWATEDPTHTFSFSLPYVKEVHPDFIFTICPSRIELYNSIGIKAEHLDFGYHESVHFRTEIETKYKCKIAVVANAYPKVLSQYPQHFRIQSLEILLKPLLKNGIRVDFWGGYWDCMSKFLDFNIPEEWIHGYVKYEEANKIYSSADITIGFQNQLNQVTQRTYEILGSEGFLLTVQTPEIIRLFRPGHDLVASKTPESTLQLVKHYLNNSFEREKIRKNGNMAVKSHSYRERAQYMIVTLQKYKILKADI